MATTEKSTRTDSMRVRIAPEMMERFDKIASRYGFPPSTLAAFAISKFVQSEENTLQFSRMAIMDATRKQASQTADMFNEEAMERVFGPLLENIMKEQLLLNASSGSEQPENGTPT